MLYLTKQQRDEIIAHARRESPDEACGILAGRGKQNNPKLKEVKKIYEMHNADKSTTSFFMDAKEQLKVVKEIRANELEMVGIYHSHPASPAYPSAEDVRLAFYPDTSYCIISLSNKHNPDISSFKIREGKIIEEGLKIV